MDKRNLLLIALLFNFLDAFCQSANDQSSGVEALPFNAPLTSSTDFNTVQKTCIDEKLTGQCIQYHNDQWFSYLPQSDKPFFVNVYGQSCKNEKGVQLVVFTGELCETASYQILQCVSTATPADFYYKVEHPVVGAIHYIIIDGYLGDFCSFTIEVADVARGLPASPGTPGGEGQIDLEQNIAKLKWTYNPETEEQWNRFEVIRAAGGNKTWSVPLVYNTSGRLHHEYELLDTLTEAGSYRYDVYLVNENEEHKIHFTQTVVWTIPQVAIKTTAYFPFEVPRKTDLQVSIRDPFTGRVLLNKFVKNYSLPGFEYDFTELTKNGNYFFEVQVQDLKTKRKEIFTKSFAFD